MVMTGLDWHGLAESLSKAVARVTPVTFPALFTAFTFIDVH